MRAPIARNTSIASPSTCCVARSTPSLLHLASKPIRKPLIEDRRRIGAIVPGDDAEHCAGIRRAPGNDPDMVQRGCQFEHAVAADASPAWLQAGQAVGGARPADRSAGIGGKRAV